MRVENDIVFLKDKFSDLISSHTFDTKIPFLIYSAKQLHVNENTHIYMYMCLVTQMCLTFCNPMDCSPPGSSVNRDSPGQNTGVGCHALLQGIFPTHGSNPGLLHCKWILYQLSYQGNTQNALASFLNPCFLLHTTFTPLANPVDCLQNNLESNHISTFTTVLV